MGTIQHVLKKNEGPITEKLDTLCVSPPNIFVNVCSSALDHIYPLIVDDVSNTLLSNGTVANVTEGLDGVCKVLPPEFYQSVSQDPLCSVHFKFNSAM